MGSRDGDTTGETVITHGKIDHVRGDFTQVDNVMAGIEDTLDQALFERRGGKAHIHPDGSLHVSLSTERAQEAIEGRGARSAGRQALGKDQDGQIRRLERGRRSLAVELG